MAIFKAEKLTDQQTILHHQGQYYAVVSAGVGFRFSDPREILSDSETQELMSQYIPQVLDEGFAKLKPEVMVVGNVNYPGQEGRYTLRLQMPGVDKSLMIFAPRKWAPGPLGTVMPVWDETAKVQDVPLTWQNAFGGSGHLVNPCGVGYAKGHVYFE